MALLSAVVGYTTSATAQILGIFDRTRGLARIAWRDANGQRSLDVPIQAAEPCGVARFRLEGLAGGAVAYEVGDAADAAALPDAAALLGDTPKTFRTVAAGPRRIALVSCNDIHADEVHSPRRGAMWRRLRKQIEAGEVDLVVHAGDQVYADGNPKGLLPGEGKEVAYRRHYLNTWSHPDVSWVLGRCPNLMMWDDHEIYDGWGSHDDDGTEAAQVRFRAAELAFKTFQDPLNPPDRLAKGLGWLAKYGDLAVLAVDGRSQRSWAAGTILGKAQLDDLQVKLAELAQLQLKQLFVVVGTPVVYVPLIAAEKAAALLHPSAVDDLRDGWTASKNRQECRRFLMTLLNFAGRSPDTQVTIIGGDIHVGTLARIDTQLGFGPQRIKPRIYQVASSGIARPAPKGMGALGIRIVSGGGRQDLFNEDITGKLLKVGSPEHDYCVMHRNFAVLDPSDGKGGWDPNQNLWVRFHVERAGDPVIEHQLVRKHA